MELLIGYQRHMQKILEHLVFLFFMFPFIPGVFPGDLQPYFIVFILLALISRGIIDKYAILFFFTICLISYLGISWATPVILFGILTYVLSIVFMSRASLDSIYFWVRFKLFFLGVTALIFLLTPEFFGDLRFVLGLRDSDSKYFSELFSEHSYVLVFMALIYTVICGLNFKLKKLYFLVCIPIVAGGSQFAPIIFLVPMIIEVCSKIFRVDSLKLLVASSLCINLSVLIIGLMPQLLDYVLFFLHRSEQVRLYDLAMISQTLLNDPLSLKTFDQHMLNTKILYPDRFKDNFLGTTSALSKVVIELGLPGLVVLLLFCRRYFINMSLFLLSILTSVGIGWSVIALLAARRKELK